MPKFEPIKNYVFCDLSVHEKNWRAARVEKSAVSAKRCLQCEAGELAGVTRKGGSQAFERMHNTLSNRVQT